MLSESKLVQERAVVPGQVNARSTPQRCQAHLACLAASSVLVMFFSAAANVLLEEGGQTVCVTIADDVCFFAHSVGTGTCIIAR